MEITIKKMETDEEIKGKAFVHFKSWQEAYSGIVEQVFLDKQTIEKCLEIAVNTKDNTIIAKKGNRVVGFVQYGKYHYEDLEQAGEIIALYVLADYYGKGIGYRLMQEAMKSLSGYSQIALFVIKDNQRAIDFYSRYGFRFDGQEGMSQVGVTVARMILKRQIPV
ncbi:MAG: GNAT family N-acetyltransferase [Acidaminococcaceae bacterium]|nr:GNAT family N-acetyltransferase [Acidaminococcaceae bacterium]